MKECAKILKTLKIKYQISIVSAHRTPKRMFEFAESASKNGFGVIVAGAGGSAHLPGMVASLSSLPVIGVPIETKKLNGLDSILSMAMCPQGCPLATMPIGKAGAVNAALFAAEIIGTFDTKIKANVLRWKRNQTLSAKKKLNFLFPSHIV